MPSTCPHTHTHTHTHAHTAQHNTTQHNTTQHNTTHTRTHTTETDFWFLLSLLLFSFFKHLYEHHPKWQYVAETYNMSKHQQVQMMQTAELLLSLRQPLKHGLQPLVRFDL